MRTSRPGIISVPSASDPVAEAQPLLRRRPAAADPGVHDHEARDPVGLLDREAEPDRAAPVLDDDGGVAQVELLDEPRDRPGVEVVGVVVEPERLVGAAEAEVVGRDRAGGRRQLRDDLAVEVRPGRLAVQQQHRRARALVEVVQPEAVLLDVVRLEVVAGETARTARPACGRPPRARLYAHRIPGAVSLHVHGRAPRIRRLTLTTRPSSGDEWGPEDEVVRRAEVEEEEEPPGPRPPTIWPWLLALLVLVLGGLGALWYFTQEDEDDAAETTATAARTARRCPTWSVRPRRRRPRPCATRASRRTWSRCRAAAPAGPGRRAGAGRRAGGSSEGSIVRINVSQPRRGAGDDGHDRDDGHDGDDDDGDHDRGDHDRGDHDGSGEPEPATVPDVVGKELADAARGVRRRGPPGGRSIRSVERAARHGRRAGAAAGDGAHARRHRSVERLDRRRPAR